MKKMMIIGYYEKNNESKVVDVRGVKKVGEIVSANPF
jgi:hypothetical protein